MGICTVMIAPATGKRKNYTRQIGTRKESLLEIILSEDYVGDNPVLHRK